MKEIIKTLTVAILGGLVAVGGYKYWNDTQKTTATNIEKDPELQTIKTNFTSTSNVNLAPTDFTEASEKALNAVVHVKNTEIKTYHNPFDFYFGNGGVRKRQIVGTGSGVIITADGFIITNNHVISGAEELEVTLHNRKKYKAKLVGTDKQNDIALIKIETEEDLPFMQFGNSDNTKVGEWVLAVGNPYNLTSTVTAGIISAKGRDLSGDNNVNAYIQTDAAVNSGNSGGALVNIKGELIGINTAITSQTGAYIGYSFAVPSNIAKKIIDDILEFGGVQEALLGISFNNSEDEIDGVKITEITDNGGAEKAGLKTGDIIKKINNVKISKFSDLKGQLSAKRPNDKVTVVVDRDGEKIEKIVTLGKRDYVIINDLRIALKDLSEKDKSAFNLDNGAKIIENQNPALSYYGVKKGYIITKINREDVKDAVDAKQKLMNALSAREQIYLEVINLNGKIERYGFAN